VGTFRLKGDTAREIALAAMQCGYRHIDTASCYRNEKQIGEAVRLAIEGEVLTRDELFITSKAAPSEMGYDGVIEACETSLRKLGVAYLDLYLLHWPAKSGVPISSSEHKEVRKQSWLAMEHLRRIGTFSREGPSLRLLLARVVSLTSVKACVDPLE
jgi:diketogulonate reductase-like aldo/keto reductase